MAPVGSQKLSLGQQSPLLLQREQLMGHFIIHRQIVFFVACFWNTYLLSQLLDLYRKVLTVAGVLPFCSLFRLDHLWIIIADMIHSIHVLCQLPAEDGDVFAPIPLSEEAVC